MCTQPRRSGRTRRRLGCTIAIALATMAAAAAPVAPAGEVPQAGFWLLEPVIQASRQLEETASERSDARSREPAPRRAPESSHERALVRELRSAMRSAGPSSGAWVRDTSEDRLLFGRRSRRTLRLGSNAKLFTVAATLARLGPEARLETTVVGDGRLTDAGAWSGDLYLVGGGDPSLDRRTIEDLAAELADDVGIERVTGRVFGDDSLFDDVRATASTGGLRSVQIGGSLSALGSDDVLAPEPARWAAARLDEVLERKGVDVRASPDTGTAPSAAQRLASASSPTIARLARTTLRHSSNFYAEMLAKGLGTAGGRGTGTTDRGTAAAARFARRFGAAAELADGGGLAAGSRGSARSVGRLLEAMLDRPEHEAFVDALAVAGRRGTLRERMRDGDAEGSCSAKTGTRPRVSALSGYCRGRDGDTIVFSFVLNGVDPVRAKRLEDRMVEAIARHG